MPKLERRRYPRFAGSSTATLGLGADELGLFEVLDLSAGGALVRGPCPVRVGQEMKVRLHFSPFEVVVEALVVREAGDRARPVFALQFAEMVPELRACLQSLLEQPGFPGDSRAAGPFLDQRLVC